MVRLHTSSLLAITLATGSALATSNEYQRRNEVDVNNQVQQPIHPSRFGLARARHDNLQSRGFVDEEDLFVRDDAFDDLEARNFGKATAQIVERDIHKHAERFLSDVVDHVASNFQSRSSEEDNNLFVRDLDAEELFGREYDPLDERDTVVDEEDLFVRDDAFDDLEARGVKKKIYSAIKGTKNGAKKFIKKLLGSKKSGKAEKNPGGFDPDPERLEPEEYTGDSFAPRSLEEEDNNLFVRDLDAEELFGREYDLLDVDERDTIDNEDLFERDFDGEELFGREYYLLD